MTSLDIPTARVFAPLLELAPYKAAWGGRGSGKSHFFAGMGIEKAVSRPAYRLLCVREVQKSLKESSKKLLEDKISAFGLGSEFSVLRDEIKTPGGGVISFVGMQDHNAETIKSYENYDDAWIEEAQSFSARSLELLRPTLRNEDSEIWASFNPRSATDPIDKFFRGLHPPEGSVVVKALYKDNPWFPSKLEKDRQHDLKYNRDRYAHIWEGDYEPQAIGAIWSRETLHATRVNEAPPLTRIVVAVDPAISSETGSNENGIIAVALGEDGHGYVLSDNTLQGTPRQWADMAVATYDNHDADCVVIEINQGGEMCKATLHAARPGLPVREVRATRGKHVRAEPISALYQMGRVHHVGTFDELEDQLCKITADGYEGDGSPDRADALVWGLTELFPNMTRRTEIKTTRTIVSPQGDQSWMG